MHLEHLWLTNFRSYASAEVQFAPGLTAVLGANGRGKTNLLEALGYLATLKSFRGVPTEALVRAGTDRAIVRAEGTRDQRSLLLEAELLPGGRGRMQLNKQRVPRARDLLGAMRVSVFSPDDLVLVKGGPGERRSWIDDALVAVHVRNDAMQADVDRILRQRNALLKRAGGRLSNEAELTLDVFDHKFAAAGEALVAARLALLDLLRPHVQQAYTHVAQRAVPVEADYVAPWQDTGLAEALAAGRTDDLRRGVSLVGPHRDEVSFRLNGLPSRTHASQGEQRSLSLALRLAAHHVVTAAVEEPPVLLLDDVFSELDPDRSAALLTALPPGQAILTTAGVLPAGAEPELVVRIEQDDQSGTSVVRSS